MAGPSVAIAAGLGMVHQHFKLVPSLTVAANVFLGMEIHRRGLIDHHAQIRETRRLSRDFGLQVDPTEAVGLLSVGIEQRIEILKVLARGARIIILDEPTAVLTPQESRELFQTLRGFVAQGMTVIFITHHLEEVMAVSDRVTVLRHDIGATEAIHDEIMRQREAGRAVLLISVQLDELIAIADRILVMFGGRIMGDLPGEGVSEQDLGLLMAGVAADGDPAALG
jgi:ABC-type uncharacterized transport system ATPase subunit